MDPRLKAWDDGGWGPVSAKLDVRTADDASRFLIQRDAVWPLHPPYGHLCLG